jgi:hypothetical protein
MLPMWGWCSADGHAGVTTLSVKDPGVRGGGLGGGDWHGAEAGKGLVVPLPSPQGLGWLYCV